MSRTARFAAGEPGTAGKTSPSRREIRYRGDCAPKSTGRDRRRRPPCRSHSIRWQVMSQNLITYFDASILSCPGLSGARSVGEGAGSVPVACGRPTGVRSAHLLPIYRYLRGHLIRFTAVYAHLFYAKLLTLMELFSFDPLFSSKWPSVLQRSRRPAFAQAPHRQGAGRPREAKHATFYYATNLRFSTMTLSHKLITYMEALIPPCPARKGSGRSGDSQAATGVFFKPIYSVFTCQSFAIGSDLRLFMPIYSKRSH